MKILHTFNKWLPLKDVFPISFLLRLGATYLIQLKDCMMRPPVGCVEGPPLLWCKTATTKVGVGIKIKSIPSFFSTLSIFVYYLNIQFALF